MYLNLSVNKFNEITECFEKDHDSYSLLYCHKALYLIHVRVNK